jgi:hypothetical protein
MTNAVSPWRPPRLVASGWLTSSVLLIGLIAVPGANADTIPDWNLITANALQTAKAGTGLAHSRVYAMVHGAMFDAVNAIDRRYQSYAADLKAPVGACPDTAATVAAHTVLVDLYPLQKDVFDTARAASLAKVQDGQAKADGAGLARRRERRCSTCAATTR